MGVYKCHCSKFVANVVAVINGLQEIIRIEGDCKRHGRVDVTQSSDWDYEDFDPEAGEGEEARAC